MTRNPKAVELARKLATRRGRPLMFVDTSCIVAVIAQEEGAGRFSQALFSAGPCFTARCVLLESTMTLVARLAQTDVARV